MINFNTFGLMENQIGGGGVGFMGSALKIDWADKINVLKQVQVSIQTTLLINHQCLPSSNAFTIKKNDAQAQPSSPSLVPR